MLGITASSVTTGLIAFLGMSSPRLTTILPLEYRIGGAIIFFTMSFIIGYTFNELEKLFKESGSDAN